MKPKNAETLELDDIQFHVGKLSTFDGLRVGARLLNALSGGLGSVDFRSLQTGDGLEKVFAGLLANPSLGDDLCYFTDAFAALTECDWREQGKPMSATLANVLDMHFQGQPGRLLRWLAFALRTNFGSFLGELGALAPATVPAPPPNQNPDSPSEFQKG